jgi:hypothetical protein
MRRGEHLRRYLHHRCHHQSMNRNVAHTYGTADEQLTQHGSLLHRASARDFIVCELDKGA